MQYSIRIPKNFGLDMGAVGYVRKTLKDGGYPSGITLPTDETDNWSFDTGEKTLDDKTAEILRRITRHKPVRLDTIAQSS